MITSKPGSSDSAAFSAASRNSGVPERRRAPRIAPLGADVYPVSAAAAPESSLQDLKSRPVQPGQASFFYYDPHFQYNAVKVLPGEYYVTDKDMLLVTVLGSCVAACIRDCAGFLHCGMFVGQPDACGGHEPFHASRWRFH